MDDLLKKSIENILQHSVNSPMTDLLRNNLSQAVQILCNINSYEKACAQFETLLTEHRSLHLGARVSLNSVMTFKNAKANCEKKVFELVNVKIDEFLELADYDWMATAVSKEASSYLNGFTSLMQIWLTILLLSLLLPCRIYRLP